MKNIQREDIQILSRYSDLTEKEVAEILEKHIYTDKSSWQKFLQLFLMTLGIGFTVSGIIFFFAYNWADLPKFAKIGLTEGLVIAATALTFLPKINPNIRKIILTGAAVLVGVLFAVFGQIYQTGANAYDFFLAWTIFITLWVIISDFAPLWLIYIILINTTFVLYTQQVGNDQGPIYVFTILFLLNGMILVSGILISMYKKAVIPSWFTNVLSLAVASFATCGIVIGIFDNQTSALAILAVPVVVVYALGILYALKVKNIFYLAVIPLSIVIIITVLIFRITGENVASFLFVSLFILGSITLVIKNLLNLQKKWKNEK
ncbi:DUF2157 domain-containing protein [Chryseobacterium sp. 2987]|uniref:DUF2157 domain-containing protein n=1 Tax=Chryseobacterium sp. 2987 TaxID=2817767 RepID=UPI0028562C8B|nr:DUF2157 domain-containing protein [Chryseobacterium sp. 2987]MDR6921998.1 putative membrane protein [Chryseobacterium sp. 2987]